MDAAVAGGQAESLFDQLLPVEVGELPQELAVLDRLLADPGLLAPIGRAWEQTARDHGRPTIPMASFVRLMVVKQRTGWGYETLVREVSDSLHLRRFCLLALTERVPDESTVRKLVCRLGAEVVAELTRVVIGKARRETRFAVRAVRIDSTVVEADIRTRPTRCWLGRAPGHWPARTASWPVGCTARPGGWSTVPADRQDGAGHLQDPWPALRAARRGGAGSQRQGRPGDGPLGP